MLEKMTERIGREMTCLVAIRASTQMIESGVLFSQPQLQVIFGHIVEYVRKTARSLRVSLKHLIPTVNTFAPDDVPQLCRKTHETHASRRDPVC